MAAGDIVQKILRPSTAQPSGVRRAVVAGALLGAGLANTFLGLHLGISVLAVYAAWRLRAALRPGATPAAVDASPEPSRTRSDGEDAVLAA